MQKHPTTSNIMQQQNWLWARPRDNQNSYSDTAATNHAEHLTVLPSVKFNGSASTSQICWRQNGAAIFVLVVGVCRIEIREFCR